MKKTWSFIDFKNQDFVKWFGVPQHGETVRIKANNFHEAENWLLDNEGKTNWTNYGVRFWCWEDEEDN